MAYRPTKQTILPIIITHTLSSYNTQILRNKGHSSPKINN